MTKDMPIHAGNAQAKPEPLKREGRDQWGGGNGKGEGPPDLEDLFRQFREKFAGGKFSRGSGKKSAKGSSGGGSEKPLLLGILLLLVGFVAYSSIFTVQTGERAVITQFGRYTRTAEPGLNFRMPWPVESHDTVNIDGVREISLKGQAVLTSDENIVVVDMGVQYNIKDAANYLFLTRNPDETLQSAVESVFREIFGKNNMDFIIFEGREIMADQVRSQVQTLLDSYGTGLNVLTVNMERAQPPDEVQAAFSDAISAREDMQRYINEAEAYANEIVPRARGDGRRVIEEANAYRTRIVKSAIGEASRFSALYDEYRKSPQVVRDRLYIETMERLFAETSKVIIDNGGGEGGQSLFYVPLDRLIEQRAAGLGSQRLPGDLTPPGNQPDEIYEPSEASSGSNQGSRSRGRQ